MAKTDTDEAAVQGTEAPVSGDVASRWYLVLHAGVAGYWQGQTISDVHLRGHDVPRLLALGAIAETGSRAAVRAQESGIMPSTTPEGADVQADVPDPKPEPFIAQPALAVPPPAQYEVPADAVATPADAAETTV